ncbi:MAG: FecR domain-containing protein [Bacteroidales bacterium]|nr:FecR domain-containing protein [Bacteroidales bacterium]
MKELNETPPIPDVILQFLTQQALGKLDHTDLGLLEQWIEQNPERIDECIAYKGQLKKYYWIYLSKSAKEPETIIDGLLGKRQHQSKTRAMLIKLLPYAAALFTLVGLGWFLLQFNNDTESSIAQTELKVLERYSNAVLVLSDGKQIVLDDESTHLSGENGVRITNQPGEFLRYDQEAVGGDAPRMNRLIVPAGARYQLQLADGTRVWMNSRSELEYPVAFSTDLRRVKLSGEAFFEVMTNSSAPFIIEANGYEVLVHGTAFNVSAYNDDNFIQTTLVSGVVEMSSREGLAYKLNPGQMAMFSHQSQKFEIGYVDTRLFTSWKEGVLHFNKISLQDLATKLERWYDVEISFENELAAGFQFSGAMENSREIRFLLDLIGRAANVEFEINGKQIIVK